MTKIGGIKVRVLVDTPGLWQQPIANRIAKLDLQGPWSEVSPEGAPK